MVMDANKDASDYTHRLTDAESEDGEGWRSWWGLTGRRLRARRWVLAAVFVTLLVFKFAYSLPFGAAFAGFGFVVMAAALSPREGIVHITRVTELVDRPAKLTPSDVLTPVLRGLNDPVIVLSASGNTLLYNEKAEDIFEDIKPGRHISGVLRQPQVLDAVNRVKTATGPLTVVYAERVPVERHLAATISWIAPPDATYAGPAILIFLRDFTEQERLDQMRADFVAYASHELKTPLASLIGFIETLQGWAKNDPDARSRFLDIMLRQAERMSRLIENLLSLSRVEMRAHLKPDTPIDLVEVVQHAVQSLEPLAQQSGVGLELKEFGAEALILGDRDEMTQVFQNLIHNAIKYGREGGTVRLRLARMPGDKPGAPRLAVTVEDDGLGIPPQHLPRLTERFYRVSQDGPAEKNGTGLGLAIAHQVITRHRGELKISSKIGDGSAFTVILNEHRLRDRDMQERGHIPAAG